MSDNIEEVTCQVCQAVMKSINNRHLSSHGMSAADYRRTFPDALLRSQGAVDRKKASAARANAGRKGQKRTPEEVEAIRAGIEKSLPDRKSRKGVPMSPEQKALLSQKALADYASGHRLPANKGKTVPDDVRLKISTTLSGRIVGPDAALKAVETKRMKGVPLGLPEGYRHTAATRRKLSESGTKRFFEDRAATRSYMLDRIAASDLTLLSALDDPVFRLQCNVCSHLFTRTPQNFHDAKWQPKICDQCHPISAVSIAEDEIASFIASIAPYLKMVRSDCETIAPLELDINLPDIHLAIEFCGLYWHSETAGKHRMYHRFKYDKCKAVGVRLLTVFEDEWKHKRTIVESMIANALGVGMRRIHARSCEVSDVPSDTANSFLAENHVMGRGRSNVRLGLYFEDRLVSLMTFSQSDATHKNKNGWEINRFCSTLHTAIPGAASRLFKYFFKAEQPERVVSYADLRWGTGNVYSHMGFVLEGETVPGYWYFQTNSLLRKHRYALRLTEAERQQGLTETAARLAQGYHRIFDCGHAKWVWHAG